MIFDIIFLAIIIACAIAGYRRGLVLTLFKLLSFILAIVLAWVLYPYIASLLENFGVTQKIYEYILNSGLMASPESVAGTLMKAPDYLSSMVSTGVIEAGEAASRFVTDLIINLISFIIALILVNIILGILQGVLKIISKLPVIGCLNKIGGIFAGVFEAVLIVYILLAVAAVFTPVSSDSDFNTLMKQSVAVNYMYENNPIIDAVMPNHKNFDNYI